MSFILDALKKSEAERQRQAGPTLLEVRVVPPRRRFQLWSVVLGALLTVNLGLLLWFLLRKPPAATSTTALDAAPTATAGSAAPALPAPFSQAAPQVTPPATPVGTDTTAGVSSQKAAAAAYASPGYAAAAAQNPADFEPAVPAGSDEARGAGSVRVERDASTLPSFAEVGGNIPPLRLDLHVYSERAADRYSIINMHKAREGDVLPEGARVIEITKDGVVLDYRGQQFLLRQE